MKWVKSDIYKSDWVRVDEEDYSVSDSVFIDGDDVLYELMLVSSESLVEDADNYVIVKERYDNEIIRKFYFDSYEEAEEKYDELYGELYETVVKHNKYL